MSDSDSGGYSSARLRVFKGGVNDSYPHYRIKLISLYKQKGLYFLVERDFEANPTLFVGEDYERKIITASNIIVLSMGKNSVVHRWRISGSPGQMLKALDNRYRGATTNDIILFSWVTSTTKFFGREWHEYIPRWNGFSICKFEGNEMWFARYRSGWQRFQKQVRSMQQQLHGGRWIPSYLPGSSWQIVWLQSIKLWRFRSPEAIWNPRGVREGRTKKRPDKDDSSSDGETDSKDFAKIARAVALVLKGKEMSSVNCDFLWKGRPCGYQVFPEPKQSKQSPPGQAARKTSSS
jgi:hypothetical protein